MILMTDQTQWLFLVFDCESTAHALLTRAVPNHRWYLPAVYCMLSFKISMVLTCTKNLLQKFCETDAAY